MFAHFSGYMPEDFMPVFEFNLKHSIGQGLQNLSHDFDGFFFCHSVPYVVKYNVPVLQERTDTHSGSWANLPFDTRNTAYPA